MSECWNHCAPTPDRAKEKILRWPIVFNKIIEAGGAVVPELNFRSGRRVVRIDHKPGVTRTSNLRTRDHVGTLLLKLPSHLRLKDAERLLLGDAPDAAASEIQ